MSQLDPAIRHAITPPEFSGDKIHREDLVDRLHGEIPRKLVAIATPAGYGKSTLLADFTNHTDLPVVWVQVTALDRDLMRFMSVFISALEKRFRRIRNKFDIQAYAGSSPSNLASGLISLISDNIPETFVIVFDDVHLLHSASDVMKFMDLLIEQLPEQVTIIAAGREVLEVSLAKLMAEGNLAGFGPHDLALTWDETSELLQITSNQEITPTRVSEIQEFTQGWVTGVVLSEYGAIQASLEAGISEPLIYGYLSSVVLNRLEDRLRRFALDASVIPVMTVPLCNSVLGVENSKQILEELVSKNIFITQSGSHGNTYEFHPIFREHLIETLKASSPDRALKFQLKAADIIKNDAPEVSIELYLEMGKTKEAAKVAEEQVKKYFSLDRFETIKKWYESIDDATINAPLLSYYFGVMLANRGASNQAIEIFNEVLDQNPDYDVRCLALIDKGDCLLRLGDHTEIDEILENIPEFLHHIDNPTIIAHAIRLEAKKIFEIDKKYSEAGRKLDEALGFLDRNTHQQLILKIMQDQSLFFGTAGEWGRARKAIINSLQIAAEIAPPMGQIPSYINKSHIEYLDGRFQEALQNLETARGLAVRAGSPRLEAQVLFAQGDIFSDVGLAMQAGELYERGLNVAAPVDDVALLSNGSLCASVLHRRSGSQNLANEWLRRATELLEGVENSAQIIQKAALICISNPHEAIRILDHSTATKLDKMSAQDRVVREFILAKSYFLAGEEEDAKLALANCMEQASLLNGNQFLAAELFADNEMAEWVLSVSEEGSLLKALQAQVQMIEVFNTHYAPEDTEQEKSGLFAQGLGTAKIFWDGSEVRDLKPQAMELFFMLIDEGSVERDRIIEEFWPDHPPGRQTANLHMAVYSVRRILGKENILLNGTAYSLSSAVRISCDVKDFERAVKVFQSLPPGDPRSFFALTEAVNLYQGHFLPEFYSDWVEKRRRELELSYLDIASHHADESIIRRQPSRALSTLRNALRIDPYRDDLNQLYLQALLDLGRRSEVITHFRNYKHKLQEELGLNPAEEVKAIHDKAVRSS